MINIADIVDRLRDYIETVRGMKPTKSCLCRKTVTVVTEWQQKPQFLIT